MPSPFIRRWLVILLAVAFFGASGAVTYAAADMGMSGHASTQKDCDGKTSCYGGSDDCLAMAGCATIIALPMIEADVSTHASWELPAVYWSSDQALRGRTILPDIEPPIPSV